jgi:hypothetical protein
MTDEEPDLKLPEGVEKASVLPFDRRKPAPEPFPQERRAELLKVYIRHTRNRIQEWIGEGVGDTFVVPIGPPVIAQAVVNRMEERALSKGLILEHVPPGNITVTIARE